MNLDSASPANQPNESEREIFKELWKSLDTWRAQPDSNHLNDYRILVFRVEPEFINNHRVSGYLETFKLPITIPDIIEKIGTKYGGGKYQLRIVGDVGQYIKSKYFEISGEPKLKGIAIKELKSFSKYPVLRRLHQPLFHRITLNSGVYSYKHLDFFKRVSDAEYDPRNATYNGCLPHPNQFVVKSIGILLESGNYNDFEKLLEGGTFKFMFNNIPQLEGPAKLFSVSDTNRLYRCFEKLCKNPDTSYEDFADTVGQLFERNYRGYQLDFPIEILSLENFGAQLETNPNTVTLKKPLSIICFLDGELRRGLLS